MKEVPRYEADDGTVFDTRDECLMHERGKAFRDYMWAHQLKANDPDSVFLWMTRHVDAVRKLVGATVEPDPPELDVQMVAGHAQPSRPIAYERAKQPEINRTLPVGCVIPTPALLKEQAE